MADQIIAIVNAALLVLVSLAAAWAVLDPRVREGVLIKVGLILLSLGSGAGAWLLSATDDVLIGRAALLGNVGLVMVSCGWCVRVHCGRRKHRRTSDWVPFDARLGRAARSR